MSTIYNTIPTIPFLDLRSQYAAIRNEIHTAIHRVIEECAFASGPAVAAFETAFARYCGVRHCIGVSNCWDYSPAALPLPREGQLALTRRD